MAIRNKTPDRILFEWEKNKRECACNFRKNWTQLYKFYIKFAIIKCIHINIDLTNTLNMFNQYFNSLPLPRCILRISLRCWECTTSSQFYFRVQFNFEMFRLRLQTSSVAFKFFVFVNREGQYYRCTFNFDKFRLYCINFPLTMFFSDSF